VPPPEIEVSRDPLLESGSPSESFVPAPPALVRRPLRKRWKRSRARDLPLLSFPPGRHVRQGCPLREEFASRLAPRGRGMPSPRRCRPRGLVTPSTVLAASWTVPAHEEPSCSTPHPGLAALFHAACVARASLQSLPLSRSRARSREPPAPLRVRVRRPPARSRGALRTLSPPRRPFARLTARVQRTHEP